ncbi:hypothetical protein [Lysinibacillus capsici]|uniref:hypothetical protein n=1 Tax=Lysinibacillus capsici TaxID=2115968 RepID=UPI00325FA908
MNKFDERYEIRLAKYSDIEMIMAFLNEHWREGHIMAINRELFEYEYVNEEIVNFVIAIDKVSGLLEGIFGFLNCSHPNNIDKRDIWGSMWKVVDTRENMPFLGIELAKRVVELTKCRTQIGNGANPRTTIPLRKMFFKETVGKMQHFYFLNDTIDNFKIAKIGRINHSENKAKKRTNLIRLNSIEEVTKNFNLDNIDSIPYKDSWYLEKRYFKHPIYQYEVYGIKDKNKIGAILVWREVIQNDTKIIRIMDFLGNESLFEGLYDDFKKLFVERNIEYIDFYAYGFNNDYILNAGFILRKEDDRNVIPNYFEPFLQANVDIWVHHKLPNTKFFKADGDQDRPNSMVKKM